MAGLLVTCGATAAAVATSAHPSTRRDRAARIAAAIEAATRELRLPVVRTDATRVAEIRLARRLDAASVASEAPDRTCVAVVRATFAPRGDTRGLSRRRTVAMMSPIAVTPPWAKPFSMSAMRSATPAAGPTTRFPGGVSGARGCGWVGAIFLATAMASPRSLSALRPSSSRTIGNNSRSSTST
jgi:hypothetical protein